MTPNSLSSGARYTLSKPVKTLLQPMIDRAQKDSLPIYLIGGCVRDLILGRESLDVDVVVEGPAEKFARAAAKLYKAKLVSHPAFLTHTLVLSKGRHLDIATARTETYPEPAILPVVEPASLQEDLYRRDFSLNAMAISLNSADFGHLWDPFGGLEDLNANRVRVLHSESFKDDPTRIFRAARFVGRFGSTLDWKTREWLSEAVAQQLPAKLSGARLREELVPILMEKDPRPAFRYLSDWNALGFLFPGLQWEKSHQALFGAVIKMNAKDNSLLLRLLALLHAVPVAKAVGSLSNMMFSSSIVEPVEQALQLLGALRNGELSPKIARERMRKPMIPAVKAFLDKALHMRSVAPKKEAAEEWQKFHDSAPCLSGQDLRDLGYKPGPVYKQIFEAVREARWVGKLRTREEEIRFILHSFPQGSNA